MLPADPEMDALITKIRAPYEARLAEKLAITEGTLYRRGNFNGTGDQLLVDALMDAKALKLRSRLVSAGVPHCCSGRPSRANG